LKREQRANEALEELSEQVSAIMKLKFGGSSGNQLGKEAKGEMAPRGTLRRVLKGHQTSVGWGGGRGGGNAQGSEAKEHAKIEQKRRDLFGKNKKKNALAQIYERTHKNGEQRRYKSVLPSGSTATRKQKKRSPDKVFGLASMTVRETGHPVVYTKKHRVMPFKQTTSPGFFKIGVQVHKTHWTGKAVASVA